MPPKPKNKKKGKKVSRVPLDDIDTTVLSKDKLEAYCVEVYESITKEKHYSEFLKLDRDKLTAMVAISRVQLIEIRNSITRHQHKLQEAEEKHMIIMWENRQKLMNSVIEKNKECVDANLESISKLNSGEKDHEKRIKQITSDIRKLKFDRTEANENILDIKTKLKMLHAKEKSHLRDKNKDMQVLMENKSDKFSTYKIKELQEQFGKEYKDLEREKDKQISTLIKDNVKFTTELKHYYTQIEHRNLSIINVMKSHLEKLKSKTSVTEKELLKLKEEYYFLANNLSQSMLEETSLRKKLSSSNRDQFELKLIKNKLKQNKTTLENTKIEMVILDMRLAKEEKSLNDEIEEKYDSVLKDRMKYERLILILEFIAVHLYFRNKEMDSKLEQIQTFCLEKEKFTSLVKQIPPSIDSYKDEITYQLATIARDREKVLKAYKDVLKKHMMQMEDTGYEPLKVNDILKTALNLSILVDEDDVIGHYKHKKETSIDYILKSLGISIEEMNFD